MKKTIFPIIVTSIIAMVIFSATDPSEVRAGCPADDSGNPGGQKAGGLDQRLLEERTPIPSLTKGIMGREAGFYQMESYRKLAAASFPLVDSLKVLFIRVSFSGYVFLESHEDQYFGNELRHLREYFTGASRGRFSLVCDLAPETVLLPFEMAYYGDTETWDQRIPEMMMTVVDSLDSTYDFSQYDAFAMIHAGPGRETDFLGDSPDQVWSGFIDPVETAGLVADTLGTPGIPTGDMGEGGQFFIDNIIVLPEEASQDEYTYGSLGIYAYQIGLRLGMIPLYDPTPSGVPDSQGIGTFGLMSYGLYNALGFIPAFPCAIQRYLLGWVEAVEITSDAVINLWDINGDTAEDTLLVRIPAGPSEYFLVANRLHDQDLDRRFDFIDLDGLGIPDNIDTLLGAEFDFYVTGTTDPFEYIEGTKYTDTGSGIKIWHIDERIISSRIASGISVNAEPAFKGVDLEEADGVQDMDRRGGLYAFGSYLDSYRAGVNERFSADTSPSSALNSGLSSGVSIYDISYLAQVMSFRVSFDDGGLDRETIRIAGDPAGLSPVPAQIMGEGAGQLIVSSNGADSAFIYMIDDPTDPDWEGSIVLLAGLDSTAWAGPPVAADTDGDALKEIFITSKEGYIHALEFDGSPYVIDSDGTPGTLEIRGTVITSPMEVEADGDPEAEVAVLASEGNDNYIYIIGVDLPVSDDNYAGPGVSMEMLEGKGRTISHPVRMKAGDQADGLFYAGYRDGMVVFNYVDLRNGRDEIQTVFQASSGRLMEFYQDGILEHGDSILMLTPSSGDIDRDTCDEIAIGLPGIGLVYFDPFDYRDLESLDSFFDDPSLVTGDVILEVDAVGEIVSSPALADLDGDTFLETVLRDEDHLYLFSGFGIQPFGWPAPISDREKGLEEEGIPSQPVIVDIDNDSQLEAVYNVAGNLHALDYSGAEVYGFPIACHDDRTVSPAVLRTGEGEVYIYYTASGQAISKPDQEELLIDRSSSFLSRIDPGVSDISGQGWYSYRHDGSGSGRQEVPQDPAEIDESIDENTFICYPNPVSGDFFTVRLDLSGDVLISVKLLNLEGEEVSGSDIEHPWSGDNPFRGEGSIPFATEIPVGDIASGIYICTLIVSTTDGREIWHGMKKIAIVK